ncbi:MAG TPA: flagellum-specific ATP synthase FliI, partial [Azonexus sp.]|nr:flagellum-specific ATP synthase FliI [Azonexus sp.]
GAYAPGSDPVLDQAIGLYPRMESFLQQQLSEQSDFANSLNSLKSLF